MILYKSDWKRFPQAIADTNTPNKSWVEICKLYHYMGIKNHMFPLALHDPTLSDIDPFDPNISLENQFRVAAECKINFFYYARAVARAPAGSGEDATEVYANRGNIALWWCFFNHVMTFLIQIRQTGKSLSLDELTTYLLNIRLRNTEINLLTKDDQLRVRNIRRLKAIDSELPFYLMQRNKKDANNNEIITINSLKNSLTVHVPQASPKAADKIGRGLTSPIFFIDEGPFQPNVHISVPAALSAGNDARDRAARNNEPYGTIFTTTAGKKDTKEGAYIYRILNEAAPFTEKFYDCSGPEELERVVRASSRPMRGSRQKSVFRVAIVFNHTQLGKSDEWLAKTIEENVFDDEAQIDRDMFNRWTSGTLTSPLSIEVMEKIRSSEKEPDYIEISPEGYTTNWYIPESQIAAQMNRNAHILSMDTSEASGGDDISLRIADITNGRTIAGGTYNETNFIVFAQWVAEWFLKYEKLVGIIERRSTGSALLDMLLMILPSHGIDPFKRLFNRIVNDADEYPEAFNEIRGIMSRRDPNIYVKYKKHFGFATSGSGLTSRNKLYSSTLRSAAEQIGGQILDKTTIDQILSLEIRNGRVDHPMGGHDDMVIAILLAHFMMTQGKNLSFYGINPSDVLIKTKNKAMIGEIGDYDFQRQKSLIAERDSILDRLADETNEYIIMNLERRARFLDSKINKSGQEALTIEDLIAESKSIKQSRMSKKYVDRSQHGVYDRFRFMDSGHYQYNDPTRGTY